MISSVCLSTSTPLEDRLEEMPFRSWRGISYVYEEGSAWESLYVCMYDATFPRRASKDASETRLPVAPIRSSFTSDVVLPCSRESMLNSSPATKDLC